MFDPLHPDGMTQWREQFLGTILRLSFVIGAVVAVPSVTAAIRDGMWAIVVADVVALTAVGFLWRSALLPYRARALGFVAIIYMLGASFIVSVGPVSLMYLMAFPITVSVLLGLRPAIFALVLNAVTLLSVGYLANADLHIPGFGDMPFFKWIIITMNFAFVDTLITIASGLTVRRLEQSLGEVRELNTTLEERVRKRTAQLEEANREAESFSYAVSHDLRAPLGTIDGFSSLISRSIDAQDDKRLHYVARIRAAAQQMSALIDAMLALAHVTKVSLHWQRIDLSLMARGLLDSYAERDPQRTVNIYIQQNMYAYGDERLLRQVLDNLLANAWKFTSKLEQPDISFSRQVGASGEDVYLVRDNGAGFDMAHAGKLFGAFQRLHAHEIFAGTGIGLATAHKIVLRHGGRMWAQARPGEGAGFYFTLGASPAPVTPSAP